MSVEERVIIRIDIDADIDRDLALVEARIRALEQRFERLDRAGRDVDRGFQRVERRMGSVNRVLTSLSRSFLKFFGVLTKFSFIGYAIQVGVLTTALIGANVAMGAGRLAAQGYQLALRGVAATAASVATAVATAAAAVRQFSEAQLAPFVGGRNSARQFLSAINPTVGGLLGREEATQLTGALGRSGVVRASQSSSVLRELFNITGGDSSAISSLIGALSQGGGAFGEAALALGPQGQGIFDASRGMSPEQLVSALASGSLTPQNLQGFSGSMGSTLIGTLKTEIFSLFDLIANLGDSLLEPFRRSFRDISNIIRNFIIRTGPMISEFGAETFAPAMVDAFETMANFTARLLEDNLPKLEGFARRTREIFQSIGDFFRDIGDRLRPLESGGRVLMEMFGGIFGGFAGNGILASFNELVTNNAETFIRYGDSVGNFISSLLSMGAGQGDNMLSLLNALSDAFNRMANDVVPNLATIIESLHNIVINALPPLITVISGLVAALVPIAQALSAVSGIGGGAGGLGAMAGYMALTRGMGRGRGARGMGAGLRGMGMALAGNPAKGANLTMPARVATMGGGLVGGLGLAGLGIGGGLVAMHGLGSINESGANAGNVTMSVGGATAMGAAIGMAMGGPVAAAVGAGIGLIGGGVMSFLTDRSNREREAAEREALREQNIQAATARAAGLPGANTLSRAEFVRAAGLRAETYGSRMAPELERQMEIQNTYAEGNRKLFEAMGFSSDETDNLTRNLKGLRTSMMDAGEVLEMFYQEKVAPFINFQTDFDAAFGLTDAGGADRNAQYQAILSQFGDIGNMSANGQAFRQLFDFVGQQGALMHGLEGVQLVEHIEGYFRENFGSERNTTFFDQFFANILAQANEFTGQDASNIYELGVMQQVNTELYHKNVIELEVTVPITVDGEITAEGESKIRSIFDDVYQKVETINQAPIGTNGESVGGPSTRPNIRNKSPRSQATTNLNS